MRQEQTLSPAAWLARGPMAVNPAEVLPNFRVGSAKVVRFIGPHRFYRAAGWDATRVRLASAFGSWWADEQALVAIGSRIDQFEGFLPPELLRRAWPAQYRGLAALCEDWNDMREMFRLDLPPREELTGVVGLASEQPLRSTLDPRQRRTPMLPGGGEQVYFKRTPTLSAINPLWVHAEPPW
ncbi:hypothetical protein [Aquabacterium sp.]|uniref:hypothetical protein n=1 Tax=Aquabacterium sp. TaxID=1872578 RepID=UPI003782EA00